MNKENEKTLTLEERFAHLEQIVARMENADVSLNKDYLPCGKSSDYSQIFVP